MLRKLRNKLVDNCKIYLDSEGITTYRARKEKLKIGDVSYATIYYFIHDDNYRLSNKTIKKLLDFFSIEWDLEFFEQNNIYKLYEKEKEVNSETNN